jgi:hypothetical protein
MERSEIRDLPCGNTAPHCAPLHAGYGPPDMQPTRLRVDDFGMIIIFNDN